MKIKFFFFSIIFLICFHSNNIYCQNLYDSIDPVYITVTTLHGAENVDMEEWKKIEKEYFNKVTSKNHLILAQEVLVNYFSPEISEVKLILVYKSWDDIQNVREIREQLIEQAWPDLEKRNAFFEKQNSFYTNYHSDEIYTSTGLGISLLDAVKKNQKGPLIYFEQTNILADYDGDDSYQIYIEYVKNIIHKNKYVKAYYPYRHNLGSDSREFIEMLVVNSLSDLDKMLKQNKVLLEKYIPDANKRRDFLDTYKKGVSGHTDAIYTNIPLLSKKLSM